MRIRGYDEETEEYTEDLSSLKGEVADLTKVASNNFRGISLFEEDDPDTYKSTYQILKEISEIWDDLTDKQHANLLEVLFGKMRSNVGAAILSNFGAAEKAMDDMENSAGAAMAEMDVITQSLEYKINALQQTWVNVAQNLFAKDDIKGVIAVLQGLSDIVQKLTSQFGLFGTIGITGLIANIVKLRSSFANVNEVLFGVNSVINTMNRNGMNVGVTEYAAALLGLDSTQQKLILSTTQLTAEQQEQVLAEAQLMAQAEGMTGARLMSILQIDEETLANKLNMTSTEALTAAKLQNLITSGQLTNEQAQAIMTTLEEAAANDTLNASFNRVSASAGNFMTLMAANPMMMFTSILSIAMIALPFIEQVFDQLEVTTQEAKDAAEEALTAYKDLESELENAQNEIESNNQRIQELQSIPNLTLIEQEELNKLKDANRELELMIANNQKLREANADKSNKAQQDYFNKLTFDGYGEAKVESLQNQITTLIKNGEDATAEGMYKLNRLKEELYAAQYGDTVQTQLNGKQAISEGIQYLQEFQDKKKSGIELTEQEKQMQDDVIAQLATIRNEYASIKENYIGDDEFSKNLQKSINQIDLAINTADYISGVLEDLPEEVKIDIQTSGQENLDKAVAEYDRLIQEAHDKNIDLSQTIYGNIDTNDRSLLEWSEENLSRFESAIDSWGMTKEELEGTISSAIGKVGEYDGTEIAFTPVLETADGPVLLSKSTMDSYINGLIDKAGADWTSEDLLKLDTEGLDIDGQHISNMLAGIAESAESASEAMHFTGASGAIALQKEYVDQLSGSLHITEDDVVALTEKYSSFKTMLDESGLSAEQFAEAFNIQQDALNRADNTTSSFEVHLQDFKTALESATNMTSVLSQAQQEMSTTGYLSADTIQKLSEQTGDYAKYLEVENGQIKLNVEALRELQSQNITKDTSQLEKEIDLLNQENSVLEERRALLANQIAEADMQSDADNSDIIAAYEECSEKIESNNRLIEENQILLAQYGSLGNEIYDAFNIYDDASASLQQLADLQEALGSTFTLTAQQARQFAEVYPEILAQATVAADGTIQLNESVVNAFIEGKNAEIQSSVQAEVQKLESKRALLNAELGIIDAKIAAAKSGDQQEIESAQQNATAQMMMQQAVLTACEQAGIDETTANQLALAAMSGDWDTFKTLASGAMSNLDSESADAFTSIMGNYAKTTQNLIDNTNKVIAAFSQMGLALQNAMNGVETSGYSGTTHGNTVTGNTDKAVKEALEDQFNASKSDYGSGGTQKDDSLADLQKKLQDIYNNATKETEDLDDLIAERNSINSQMAAIDSQINLLNSLGNTPLKNFSSSAGKSSGKKGSGGSGSKDTKKEVEEYIVEIDKYRDILERLSRIKIDQDRLDIKIDNAGSLKEYIALQEQYIDNLQKEMDTNHELAEARRATILQNIPSLKGMGFDIDYDLQNNKFYIKNLEQINKLQATNKGNYETIQEATNALRKETEELIDSMVELNEANQEASQGWWDDYYERISRRVEIYERQIESMENSMALAEHHMDLAMSKSGSEEGTGLSLKALKEIDESAKKIIDTNKEIQNAKHELANFYREQGYSEDSDEIRQLSDDWWDLEESIKEVKQSVIDNLKAIVEASSSAVDDIQDCYETLKQAADEYADNEGFISIDTFQQIIDMGPQYMQYLEDENGLLVINEEKIQDVIKAKTEQLALDSAMTYVEQLKKAQQEGDIDALDRLCLATTAASDATWDLVYANLAAAGLDSEHYDAALHNIEAIQSLCDVAISGIGKTAGEASRKLEDLKEELEDMKDGADNLIKYVEDMLKDRIERQVDALEDLKDAYSDIVDLKKESLNATRDELKYNRSTAEKIEEMAKLQSQIDALSLDNSHSSQAERAKLLEELADLQADLEDEQADKTVEAQEKALDELEKNYHEEKDSEIEKLEETISSEEKLYQMALEYIRDNWDTLYQELSQWNYEYGSNLQSEIDEAWEAALAAAQRYGDFVSAMSALPADIDKLEEQIDNQKSSSSYPESKANNTVVGQAKQNSSSVPQKVHDIVDQMKANSEKWHKASDVDKAALEARNRKLAASLSAYGIKAELNTASGEWFITGDSNNQYNKNKKLYSVYHQGGVVGGGSVKENEQLSLLKNKEWVLSDEMVKNLKSQIKQISILTDSINELPKYSNSLISGAKVNTLSDVMNRMNNNSAPVTITFGDTIINGADNTTLKKHEDITRNQVNQIAKMLKISW